MNDRTPTEPTLEMRLAGLKVLHDLGYTAITASDMWPVYRAMLAASPPAPAAEPVAMQWRVLEKGSPKTSWRSGDQERERGQWESVAQRSPKTFAIEERPLYTHPLDAAAIRAEADESADRQWCEGAKTAVSMLDPLVIGVDMWPQTAQAKYRAALAEIDRLIATRRSAIIDSRKARRALTDKGEAE